MTEPIIINGVDVAQCKFLDENTIPQDCGVYCGFCYEFKNCYYKQLKRKEQDYETLANQYNAVVEQNRQLQTELNEIKKDIEVGIFCITCKKENENDKLRVECEKYKNCLDEIKSEIKNKDECLDITIHQISEIINEVENGINNSSK